MTVLVGNKTGPVTCTPTSASANLSSLMSLSVYPLAEVRANERKHILRRYSRLWVLNCSSGRESKGTIRLEICYLTNSANLIRPRPPVALDRKKSIEKWSKRNEKNIYLIGARRVRIKRFLGASISCQAFIKRLTLFLPLLVSFMWTMSWSAESLVIWVGVAARTYKHTPCSFSFL